MSAEFHPENDENKEKGLTSLELGSGIFVAAATTYITIAHIIPQTDTYIAAKAPEIAGNLILWSRLGAALIVSSAGAGAAWTAGRFQKK